MQKDLGARIIAVRLLIEDSKNNQVGLFLVSAYAPVGKEDDSVWERYLGNLNLCISRKRAGDLLIIGTDANASIGVSVREDEGVKNVGRFGISHINDSGRRFRRYRKVCSVQPKKIKPTRSFQKL